MESLMMASYIRPLRKINQSIPRGSLVISSTFGKNDGPSKCVVVHKEASLPETTSPPLKIKVKGRKAKKNNAGLTVQNKNDMLKVSLRRPHPEAMFREDEVNIRLLRISVFKRPGGRQPPHISVF
ncbi:hypothetical protein L3X38_003977 [Prunus dulcis]|uniref:Uncharacterized protein n=1 Tax=Prunus dulcis TaxID=3755 RepID=A0AAD4ZN61_PRUDU|nr:hypothetical protein L3X38_003977 [Prunus dulcis]